LERIFFSKKNIKKFLKNNFYENLKINYFFLLNIPLTDYDLSTFIDLIIYEIQKNKNKFKKM
jgi:hypothetical protein